MAFRHLFPLWHRLRYVCWRLARCRHPLTAAMIHGTRITMRPLPASDYGVAYEVFQDQIYRSPFPETLQDVRRIVDVGANVGYSCLYWAALYPQARILAFEPHPRHIELLRGHLRMNGLEDRTTVHEAAAGTAAGEAWLTDSRSSSKLVGRPWHPDRQVIPVKVVDFFQTVGPGPIDLLKVDIEGGEYSLLSDPRFSQLAVRLLVVEWHQTQQQPDGRSWCTQRLSELGYQVQPTQDIGVSGLIWGRRGG